VGTYSDVFELGMLLHTLLVGKPAASSFERAFAPTMDPLDPSLSADWASLIRSAIALQPLERPQSVGEWWRGRGGEGERGRLTFSFKTAQVKLVGSKIEITKSPGKAEYFVEDLGNGVTLDMVYVPAGRFMMGSSKYDEEQPEHLVNVPAFYLSKYPITQAQYLAIVGSNPSYFKGSQRPVESVSWHDAQAFCQKLAKLKAKAYTLPSEAQWEYACRANTNTPFYFGEHISPDVVNYNGNYRYEDTPKGIYRATTTDVGSFPPNSFGLYDLHGNVWEWCLDTWTGNYQAALNDCVVETEENNCYVLRGGSWYDNARNCRSAVRDRNTPDDLQYYIGFRLALPSSPGFS
jgi:formylglycine-generating enzyme required for sulfatase activity